MAITGVAQHLKRLQRMQGRARAEGRKLVHVLADMHVDEASHLITEGSVSGKGHTPSLPGQAPNNDTGHLKGTGHVRETGELTAESVFDARYAAALEFGTVHAAERPFARPAAKKVRKSVDALAKAAVKRIVQGGAL